MHRTSIKTHACCRNNQAPIDAILALVREHDLAPEAITRIRVGVLEARWAIVAEPAAEKRRPASVVDAQFSMPFGAAVAVRYRSAGTREHRPEVIAAPEVATLMDRIECYRSPGLEADIPERWPAEVALELADGRVLRERVDFPRGDPENPLSHAEIEAKLCALTRGVLTGDGQQRVIDAVASLGEELRPAALAMLLGSSEILAAGVADLE